MMHDQLRRDSLRLSTLSWKRLSQTSPRSNRLVRFFNEITCREPSRAQSVTYILSLGTVYGLCMLRSSQKVTPGSVEIGRVFANFQSKHSSKWSTSERTSGPS